MPDPLQYTEIYLSQHGFLELPTSLWRSLGFELGDTLIARVEAGRLVLEKQETIKHRLKSRFSHIPRERSLADELIEERYEAAKNEENK